MNRWAVDIKCFKYWKEWRTNQNEYKKLIFMNTKIGTALLLTILAGCSEHKVDTKAEGEKLMSLSREWSEVAATNDIEKTLSYWADDATVMSPGQPIIKGKE